MKVQFDFSASDVADAARRTVARSQTIRNWSGYSRATWAALISLALFFALDGPLAAKAAYVALIFFLLLVVYPRIFGRGPDTRAVQYYRELLGGDGPFSCEVDISEDGLTTQQCGAETKRRWSSVMEIVETPDAVEFIFRGSGNLVVRDRAFHTSAQRVEFIEAARQFMRAAAG